MLFQKGEITTLGNRFVMKVNGGSPFAGVVFVIALDQNSLPSVQEVTDHGSHLLGNLVNKQKQQYTCNLCNNSIKCLRYAVRSVGHHLQPRYRWQIWRDSQDHWLPRPPFPRWESYRPWWWKQDGGDGSRPQRGIAKKRKNIVDNARYESHIISFDQIQDNVPLRNPLYQETAIGIFHWNLPHISE